MFLDRKNFTFAALRLNGLKSSRRITDEMIEQQLCLPICLETAEESGAAGVFNAARAMARQSDWEDITQLVMVHDRARDLTPDGVPLAELVSAGARSDLTVSMRSAARHGHLTQRHTSMAALHAFCDELADPEMGYGAALLSADALIDAGWAWYEQGSLYNDKRRFLPVFTQLFAQAAKRLEPYCALTENAPALAAAHCTLLAGQTDAVSRVSDCYEDLIDLNPRAPGHMRAFGLHLMPQWFGSFAILEEQARRCANQTRDVWGNGAYAWVWLDALSLDPGGFAYVDTSYFLEALDDILARRSSQHFINLIAAYLTRFIGMRDSGPDRSQRQALIRRRAGLLRGRLEEIHPWVWANGISADVMKLHLAGIDMSDDLDDGSRLARRALAEVFASEIAKGKPLRTAAA